MRRLDRFAKLRWCAMLGIAALAGCVCLGSERNGPTIAPDRAVQPADFGGASKPPAAAPSTDIGYPGGRDADAPALKIETIEEYWPTGNLKTSKQVIRDEEGNLMLHGVTTQWWTNGRKKSEMGFLHGVPHGPRRAWYQDGKKWSDGAHTNGRSTGTWTVWSPTGVKQQRWTYDDNGAYHGLFTVWHANLAQKKSEVEYVHGDRSGFETYWDPQGNIVLEIDFGRSSS